MKKELNIPLDNHAECVDKIVKVFDSCKTIEHFIGAKKFAMLWRKKVENEGINANYYRVMNRRIEYAEDSAYYRVE